MRLVTKDGIARLLSANTIAELAAERGISLAPLGTELLVGHCPLHPDTAGRSLLIAPRTGRFRCLVCPLHGGNVIGLVMQLDRLPFMAALERLATRAGLDLDAVMIAPRTPALTRTSEVPTWALTPPPGLTLASLDAR